MKKVSPKTIPRALLYVRTLENLIKKEKRDYVSSKVLSQITGFTDVQIRKDISHFKKVGKPRVGYQTKKLKEALEELVLQNTVYVSLFGVGNLGMAIMKYPEFHSAKIQFVNAFDNDPKKVGKVINGVKIYSIKDAIKVIPRSRAQIGVIATPEEKSQEIADIIASCGVRGIVNFSPTSVNVPEGVSVKNIDLSIEFLALYCDIQA
jgi:redox-sensing transcriptional repressor